MNVLSRPGAFPAAEPEHPDVRRLIERGRIRGYLFYEEIQKAIPDDVAGSPAEMEMIYARLDGLGIEVSTDAHEKPASRVRRGKTASAQEPFERSNDPVRIYLREMGAVKLLDREGEIEIAKRIEKGEIAVYRALAESPRMVGEAFRIAERAGIESRSVSDLVDSGPEPEKGSEIADPELDAESRRRARVVLAGFARIAAIADEAEKAKREGRSGRQQALHREVELRLAVLGRVLRSRVRYEPDLRLVDALVLRHPDGVRAGQDARADDAAGGDGGRRDARRLQAHRPAGAGQAAALARRNVDELLAVRAEDLDREVAEDVALALVVDDLRLGRRVGPLERGVAVDPAAAGRRSAGTAVAAGTNAASFAIISVVRARSGVMSSMIQMPRPCVAMHQVASRADGRPGRAPRRAGSSPPLYCAHCLPPSSEIQSPNSVPRKSRSG